MERISAGKNTPVFKARPVEIGPCQKQRFRLHIAFGEEIYRFLPGAADIGLSPGQNTFVT
ncbi:hypothetical protein EHT87_16910 [Larkinella knui]|uniref:Uncharacterized protein n=1 Tax=Larkinella knui TaxID=2025310 RepID=A0A3P1CKS8_9BACT|nr:hypothetical protein EHT87_16910 [Larkinella knui]